MPGLRPRIYNKDLVSELHVCPKCAHHFRMRPPIGCGCSSTAVSGPSTIAGLRSTDPLAFTDTKPYATG